MNEQSDSDGKDSDLLGVINDAYHIFTKENLWKQLYFKRIIL